MVLLGLRTIFDGSTYLGFFLADGKYITITTPSTTFRTTSLLWALHIFLYCFNKLYELGTGSAGHASHIHLHLPLYKVIVSSGTFFLLFVLFLSGVLGPSILARHDGGRVLIS